MKKKTKILVAVAVGLVATALFAVLGGCNQQARASLNEYTMHLVYNQEDMTLAGSECVKYFNTSENAFDALYFHLYPNAFREGAKSSVVSPTKKDEAYYVGESYGRIDIQSVMLGESQATFQICGEDDNILRVELQEILYPDESVEIAIDFVVNMPKINHRLGVGENTINFGNFYPVACVYEDGVGFSQNAYHYNGDPFYSDCANYNVTIEFDNTFQLASGGVEVESKLQDNRVIKQISALNVRDFCFVLSKHFDGVSQQVGEVAVCYYGYHGDDNLQACLDVAVDALQTFNDLFGEYPYKQLAVVKANFIHGGMEYPNIVLISDKADKADYDYVIVHEIAHQWWYGVVGNDQYNHAWLDEGLAEYSTLLFYKNNPSFGEDFDEMIDNAEKSYKTFVKIYSKVNGSVDCTMDRPVCQFATEPEYVQCTYTKGVLMFDAIKNSVGERSFLKALKSYYNKFKFSFATPADLISVFNKTCGGDMEGFINSWLYDKVVFGSKH